MDKSSSVRKNDIPNDNTHNKETQQIQIKSEPPDDIKVMFLFLSFTCKWDVLNELIKSTCL